MDLVSIHHEPWFAPQTTVAGTLRAIRDAYRNHPERYMEDTVDDGHGHHCALGMIVVYSRQNAFLFAPIADALAGELPQTQDEFLDVRAAYPSHKWRSGTSRGFYTPQAIISTCSNLLGPEFIADACDRALQKLEPDYKPESAGVANFVKSGIEVRELVAA